MEKTGLDEGNKFTKTKKQLKKNANFSHAVRTYANIEKHVPNFRFRNFLCDPEPNHEVTKEVKDGSDHQNHPRRSQLVNQTGENTNVSPNILKETQQIEGSLVIPQG